MLVDEDDEDYYRNTTNQEDDKRAKRGGRGRKIHHRAEKVKKVEYKSAWDQFCDFTSLVGFRLLHSKNSIWLRFMTCFGIFLNLKLSRSISMCIMGLSCALIFLQTREAVRRFIVGDRVTNVKYYENSRIVQPQFAICTSHQPLYRFPKIKRNR